MDEVPIPDEQVDTPPATETPVVRRSRVRVWGYYVKYAFLRVFWPRGLDWGD